MAVYRVEQGQQWCRVADDFEQVIPRHICANLAETLANHGFAFWDEVDGVCRVYQRAVPAVCGPLAGVRFVFDVQAAGEISETLLVGDCFPDYLHVVERLDVLRRRHVALVAGLPKDCA